MTIVAVGLRIVLRMTEANSERGHVLWCARISAQLMARAAGRNIATVRLRARRVTTEAGCMRIEISRYGHHHTAARRTMAGSTTDIAHANVLCVIELHPEAHQP